MRMVMTSRGMRASYYDESLDGKISFSMGPNFGTYVHGHPDISSDKELCKAQDMAEDREGCRGGIESDILTELQHALTNPWSGNGYSKDSVIDAGALIPYVQNKLAVGDVGCFPIREPLIYQFLSLPFNMGDAENPWYDQKINPGIDPVIDFEKAMEGRKDMDRLRVLNFASHASHWMGEGIDEKLISSMDKDGLLQDGLTYALRSVARSYHNKGWPLWKTLASSKDMQAMVHPILMEYVVPYAVQNCYQSDKETAEQLLKKMGH